MRIIALVVIATIFSSLTVLAQTQYSAYTAVGKGVATTFLRDYQALGINASALGWGTGFDNKKVVLGTSEFAFGISSPELNKERLQSFSNAVLNQIRDRENSEFDWNAQKDAARDYANAGIAMNFDYNWFGGSFHSKKLGGFAISIRENYSWYSRLNETTTDLIFRGRTSSYFDSLTIAINGDTSMIANNPNLSGDTLGAVLFGSRNNPLLLSQIMDGSKIKMMWNREYSFGWGRKIIGNDSVFAIYGGVGGRIIQSMAMFDLEANTDGLTMASAITPFYGIDFGAAAQLNPSNYSNNSGILPRIVGSGYGLDLGVSAVLMNKIRVAAAVNNIGKVTYTRNVYTVRDTILPSMSLAGLDDNNVSQSMNQLLEGGQLLNLVGEEEFVVTNPATFRLGGSIELVKDVINVGIDIITPFDRSAPGSLQNAVFSIGGDIRPIKWLQLSAGYFGGGVYRHNIPVGINFILGNGAYEVGIASRDMLSFFLDNSNSVSTAFGFARVRF
jgi:hypothetical protein